MSDDITDDHDLDDEFEYAGWRIGYPLCSAEVDAPDGTHTIEEGVLTCELVTKDQLREAKLDGGWTSHFVAPDGGIGFGVDDENSGGVAIPYTLEAAITFPTSMTEQEADEWLPDEWFHDYPEVDLPGLEWFDDSEDDSHLADKTAADDAGVVWESIDGELIIESDTTAADLLEDVQ